VSGLPSLVGCDGGAFDADVVLENGLGSVHRHLVVRLIAVGETQIVVLDVNVQVRQNQLQHRELANN
jgi:hypothetical protein